MIFYDIYKKIFLSGLQFHVFHSLFFVHLISNYISVLKENRYIIQFNSFIPCSTKLTFALRVFFSLPPY